MRIAIVGVGALGGYYGGLLARRGYDVHFLFHNDYKTVQRQGLTVKSINGDFHLDKVNCYDNPDDIGPVDLIFIGLKTTSNALYSELLPPLIGPGTVLLTAQNGLGNEERLAELFGAERVAGGLAFLCCQRVGPGVIEHLDYGYINIGNYLRPPDRVISQLAEMLNASGVRCAPVENLTLARWKKLVWNVPFSGLATLHNCTVDQIMAAPKRRQRAQRLMREIQAAAGAQAMPISDDFLAKMMVDTEKMKPYAPSMLIDLRNGRPLEVESILGEPVRRGKIKNIEMPETEALYRDLTIIDRNLRSDAKSHPTSPGKNS